MLKVLITGHKGFIGQNMMNRLTELGYDCIGIDRGDPFPSPDGIGVCIHLGAISSTTHTDVEEIIQCNYDYTKSLYKWCCEHNIDFQFASSASLYGLGINFNETAPVDPRTPYAWSKYFCEKYLREHYKPGIRVQIFRYFNVYGPHEDHKGTQASPFNQFRNQAEYLGYIKVFEGSEDFKRDFIHVDDVTDTHRAFFTHVKESGTWNVGTGKPMSFMDVAREFAVPIETIDMPEQLKNSYQKYTCADTRKIKETIYKYCFTNI